MACRQWACVVVAVGGLAVAWRSQAEEAPERIAELIKQLDADEFQEREQASEALQALGEQAEAALEKVRRESKSAEVQTRADALLKTLALARIRKNALKLTDFFAEAKRANEGELNAERLDALVARLIEILAAESGRKDLKPPVLVKDVGAGERMGLLRNALVIQKNGNVPFIESSVVLFETAGHVSHAKNSIIIAPLAADVSHTENCIVLGGLTTSVSFARGGIVLSGGDLDLSHGDNCFLGAGEELRTSIPQKATFVNSTPVERPGLPARAGSSSIKVEGLELYQKPLANPLQDKLKITHMSGSTSSGFLLFHLPDGSGEYVARTGQEIRSPQGRPLAGLEGWKLNFCSGRIAMFEKGNEVSIMRIGK
jgi:hypothetical protein